MIKIVYNELVDILGKEVRLIEIIKKLYIIMMIGL